MLKCLLGEYCLDHLVEFLHCEVTVSPFEINILRRHFETRFSILWLLISIGYYFLNIPKGFLRWLGNDSSNNKDPTYTYSYHNLQIYPSFPLPSFLV